MAPVRVGQYNDGPNLYQYVGDNPIVGRDPMGLEDEGATACAGVCGARIDNWVRDEIKAQIGGLKKKFGDKKPAIDDYLQWANGNQRYKDSDFFQFSKDVEGCATWPDKTKPGCGRSVTLCGKCIRSAILGNIMYGYVGHIAGFSKEELITGATATKKKWHMQVDKYDEASYKLGYDLQQEFPNQGGSLEDLCGKLDGLLKENKDALKEGRKKGGYNDLSTCKPCDKDTKETRHGGSQDSRWRP